MTLNDGHTFVRPDQIKDEFKRTLELMVAVYADFNITDYRFRLSYRDPNNTYCLDRDSSSGNDNL